MHPTRRRPLASSNDSDRGLGTTASPATTRCEAYAPGAGYTMTSSPGRIGPAGPAAPSPTAVTTPDASDPTCIGNWDGSAPNEPLNRL